MTRLFTMFVSSVVSSSPTSIRQIREKCDPLRWSSSFELPGFHHLLQPGGSLTQAIRSIVRSVDLLLTNTTGHGGATSRLDPAQGRGSRTSDSRTSTYREIPHGARKSLPYESSDPCTRTRYVEERIDYARRMAVNFRELEEGLTRLESVDAARVVNQGDRITEVHVIAAAEKPAKQVVRDVQSLSMARFGLSIDRRVISVVQISPADLDIAAVARAALTRIAESPNGSRTTLEVTLRHVDEEHVGSATGPAVASARLRLIGEATIDAVEKTFEAMPPIALDAITVARVGPREVVVAVVITAAGNGGEDLSVGSAISNGNVDDAGVKAVLDALNRRIATLP